MTTDTAATAAAEPTSTEGEPGQRGPSLLVIALIATLMSIVVVAAALLVYDRTYRKPVRYASVNVSQLIEAHELLFSDIVTSPGATDSDRERAMRLAEQLGSKLTTALEQTKAECDCLLLVSSAVVGRADADLTAAVGERIGLKADDIKAANARLRATMLAQRVGPTRQDGQRAPGFDQPIQKDR